MTRIYLERQDLPDDLRKLFDVLWEGSGPGRPGATGECTPPIDVIETSAALEVLVDLPGVAAAGVQIVFARNVLMIAGEKLPVACEHRGAAFHLAERGFGRFARAIRIEGAFDAGRAAATLTTGELRIVLPRIEDRRGSEIRIPIRG